MILDDEIHVEWLEHRRKHRITHRATDTRVSSHLDVLKESERSKISDNFERLGNRNDPRRKAWGAYDSVAHGQVELSEGHGDDE